MRSEGGRWRQHLRVTWAIAWKDILEGWKNKVIIGNLIMVILMIVFYKSLPNIETETVLPTVRVYDMDNSSLLATLENSEGIDLYHYDSQEDLEHSLQRSDTPELGLVIPADFDRELQSGDLLQLTGYIPHWVSDRDAAELQRVVETEIAVLMGTEVNIQLQGNKVYPQADSTGLAFLGSVTIIFTISILGLLITPHLILEEKRTRTLDVLLVSPADGIDITIAKALAALVYVLLAAAIALAFNAALVTHWWLVILATVVGAFFMVFIGLLLGSLVEIRQQLGIWIFGLQFLLLIPVFLTILNDLLPVGVQSVIYYIPTVALSRVLRVSFSDQLSQVNLVPDLAIILGSTLVLLVVVAWVVGRSNRA